MGSRGVSLVVALVCCALVWVGAQAVAGGSVAARSEAAAMAGKEVRLVAEAAIGDQQVQAELLFTAR